MLATQTNMKLLTMPRADWPGAFQIVNKRKRAVYQFRSPTIDKQGRLIFEILKAGGKAKPYHVTIRPDSSGWCNCSAARFGKYCCHVAAVQTILAANLPEILNVDVQI